MLSLVLALVYVRGRLLRGLVTTAARAAARAALFRVFLVYIARPNSVMPKTNRTRMKRTSAVSTIACPFIWLCHDFGKIIKSPASVHFCSRSLTVIDQGRVVFCAVR